MTFLRNLARDLVEKRLWPVAAALMLALVAVPVLLGGGSPAPAPRAPAPQAAAGEASATAAQVSLDAPVTAPGKRHRPGAVRNPFTQQHQPKATTDASAPAAGTGASAGTPAGGSTTAPAQGSGTPSGTGTGTDGASTPPGVVAPVAPRRVAPSVAQRRVYRVAIRFGETGATVTRHDAARLTALPNAAKPLAMFLGVRSDGKTAVFLLAPGVQARGDGWCRPRRSACRTLEMRARDREVLEVATGTAGVAQYNLVAARVKRRTLESQKAAERKHRRVSKAGRELLRAAAARHVPGTRSFRFDALYGVLRVR